jgi:hypothetical protein
VTNERVAAFEKAHEVQRFHRDVDETKDWIQVRALGRPASAKHGPNPTTSIYNATRSLARFGR